MAHNNKPCPQAQKRSCQKRRRTTYSTTGRITQQDNDKNDVIWPDIVQTNSYPTAMLPSPPFDFLTSFDAGPGELYIPQGYSFQDYTAQQCIPTHASPTNVVQGSLATEQGVWNCNVTKDGNSIVPMDCAPCTVSGCIPEIEERCSPKRLEPTSGSGSSIDGLSFDEPSCQAEVSASSSTLKSRALPSRKRRVVRRPSEGDERMAQPKLNESPTHQAAKQAHAHTERRYREGINTKFESLSHILASTSLTSDTNSESVSTNNDSENDHRHTDPRSAPPLKKGDILNDAITYVRVAEREKSHATEEIAYLRQRPVMLEKLVKCADCSLLKQMNVLFTQNTYIPTALHVPQADFWPYNTS